MPCANCGVCSGPCVRRRSAIRRRRSLASTSSTSSPSRCGRPASPSSSTARARRPTCPSGVDLSAYRIVQEALTNTLRHARASLAEVTFRYRSDVLEIEVVDNGRVTPARSGGEPGFGLIGMRERAALHGGSLEAGPTAHGGYRVHALLPLDAAP